MGTNLGVEEAGRTDYSLANIHCSLRTSQILLARFLQ
jgi:hypothetical protein